MPITTSAKKALRQSKRKKTDNVRHMNKIRLLAKQLAKLSLEKKIAEAKKLLPKLYRALDQAVKKNILKKNTVARRKSRSATSLNKLVVKK
ncbi:hypothetical protein A3C91_04170 [Candidatus Azambacteria bacterium RIFCSPHIGHO2_02_FULL_52_12]|uniref:Small ribosomal subunit protein bS20 n=1 Tax=Candidatus Azambacteria bacterium RIFCSPLOWO2_01_FULL_46_25 TaxID=1797298 RepID=A0A1F5BUZ0_9BACT|nr:MAG: hypothetical protein A3C91_04170 [Candidatus Azambacteria bacterium RIFCSPHIGHO2_02_FULL_52_12]OGD34439.1 MAG: hypothetical protein A2988_02855 [Candidatus Azambacteria bacterium RIFCSPLOWO2_01_FULL_46_25]OGD37283.1 MAG: hypothetical protein A2850_01035 [Candidatus Azambacteria bacterium RIFCSPHIGHO2_01_FULL_51_74]